MPASPYIADLRERIGHRLLLLPSVTCVVFDDHDRVLLVEHGDTGRWVAPGGSIEPGEVPADAAVRELWEETGLEATARRILGVFGGRDFVVRYGNGDEVSYVMTVFECAVTGGRLRPDGEEVLATGYFSVEDLPTGLAPWARVVLPSVMADRATASFQAPQWTPQVG
jgi:8-oxo-dGTP pyrophosphatase MutT (NUDIX family)